MNDELLTPDFNAYNLWIQYQAYDVTNLFTTGLNVIGAWLGDGYYKGHANWPGILERRGIFGNEYGFIAGIDISFKYPNPDDTTVHTNLKVTEADVDLLNTFLG